MALSLSGLSASVTRILSLTGFPKELKTKDIQSAFSDYEGMTGGFKIKWRDDTSLLIVFQDAAVGEFNPYGAVDSFNVADLFTSIAKRAYLTTLAFPPPILTSSSTGISATIKPYDGPDAQSVIQTVNSRHNPSLSRSQHARAASVAVFPNARSASISGPIPQSNVARNNQITASGQHVAIPENSNMNGREPSPTLPPLLAHPTLNALINSSLGETVAGPALNDPAIVSTSLQQQPQSLLPAESVSGPRIGDPGKRMLGAALGVRHPGLLGNRMMSNGGGQHMNSGNGHTMRDNMQRAMGGLVVAE
jgi:hypothetical protein